MAHLAQWLPWRKAKPLLSEAQQETQWHVGGRYELLQPMSLFKRPDLSSEKSGRLLQHDPVLLLAIEAAQPGTTRGGSVLLAYLASTRQPTWVHGWGSLEAEGVSAVRRRRLRGSWEVGGRYRVVGSPVLRAGIDLESEELYEIPRQQEVLVLELGLVLREGLPRLRAYVRTDAGQLGWLTVELPEDAPLLEPVNLYRHAAAGWLRLPWRRRPQPAAGPARGVRVSLTGVSEGSDEPWEAGGKYRMLHRTTLFEDADLHISIGSLKTGDLVLVEEVRAQPGHVGPVRLRVSAEGYCSRGWMSTVSSSGEVAIDVRDHLEYEKLLRSCLSQLEREFSVQLHRHSDMALGIHVDHSDGLTLVVKAVTPGGLFEVWNSLHPDRNVHVGDRLLSVNGCCGDAGTLIEKLSREPVLDLTFQTERPVPTIAGSVPTNPVPHQEAQFRRPRPEALQLESDAESAEVAGVSPEALRLESRDEPVETAGAPPEVLQLESQAEPAETAGAAPEVLRLEAQGEPSEMMGLASQELQLECRAEAAETAGAAPKVPVLQGLAAAARAETPALWGGPGAPGPPATAAVAPCPQPSGAAATARPSALCQAARPFSMPAADAPVKLFVTEEGPDWEPVDGGAAECEEPATSCPCRADRAWVLNGIGCGGDVGRRRLLWTHGVLSHTPGRGGHFLDSAFELGALLQKDTRLSRRGRPHWA